MSTLGWALLGVSILALMISTVLLIKIRKRSKLSFYILLVFVVVLVASLVAVLAGEEFVAVINVLVLTALVLITAEYVKEVREQRLSEAQPYLLLRLKDQAVQWDEVENRRPPNEFALQIRNEGKGPAINLSAYLWHPTEDYPYDSRGYLAPGEEWEATICRLGTTGLGVMQTDHWLSKLGDMAKYHGPGIVAVEYKDIHERTWASYMHLEGHFALDEYVMGGDQSIKELRNND